MSYGFNITGRVASATDDTPLAGATIRMITLPDSTFVVGTFADRNGNFTLHTSRLDGLLKPRKAHQKVMIHFTYVGYQATLKTFTLHHRQKSFALGDVYMQEEHRLLGEAVVSATPPPMVIREDTIEYYASSYRLEPDATAEDLLKRLAGVEVAADGTITAQGETVARVYVDGREFFGSNTQATTRNLTADMVESVQVVDMKTEESRLTGIDNGEREKVVNLKLKPKMRRGYFGNAAGAWGDGRGISDRFEAKGMAGYFRGDERHALVVNANNTNNTGFGDMGEKVMRNSTMRSGRNSGQRGEGLNTSWSAGLNLSRDKGNRLRDENTPLAVGGDAIYGGERQSEQSSTHRINYLKSGNTGTDAEQTGDNKGQNVQLDFKFEKTWGKMADGEHRLQVSPELAFNSTETDEHATSRNYHLDPEAADEITAAPSTYISQTQRTSHMKQQGASYELALTYSYAKQTNRGRRRSSLRLGFSGRNNDGDHFTLSATSYDSLLVNDLSLTNDTTINQWQEERQRSMTYRVRLTHVEPLAEHHLLELGATGSFTRNAHRQLYHFWDDRLGAFADTVGGRSNIDYSTDSRTQQNSYTLSASYRYVTERVNASLGMDLLPNTQRYTDLYDHSRDYKRSYMNLAPRVEYRYNWNRRKNLRITLNGRTTQPSISQLQARKNQTSATHVTLGNQNLEPSYQTNMQVRYRANDKETGRTMEASMQASAQFNTLATKRWYSADLRTDTTMTVNLDGLGAWNVQGEFRGSFPFADNHWYVTTYTTLAYRESVGYANLKSTDTQVNHIHNFTAGENASIAYRNDRLNVELHGNYHFAHSKATVMTSGSLGTTHQFGVSCNISAQLPWNLSASTSIAYTGRRGYAAALSRNQTLWNAQLSRAFLQRKNLSAFVKVFDILNQKTSVWRTISATSVTDRETTTLRQYFLVGCSVKFNQRGRGGQGGKEGRGKRERQPRQD